MKKLSRREMLAGMSGAVAGSMLMFSPAMAALPQTPTDKTWTAHKLDPKESAPYAYAGYWNNGYGCCYGAFYGIIGVMAKKYGTPYSQFPFHMMEVGKSGISGWGTICGTLLGAASAFALFWGRKERDPMVHELFRWYEQTAFPIFDPGADAIGKSGPLPTCVTNSVLCHVSASRWSNATGVSIHSKARSERCSRTTVDVTQKAIEIMNAKIDGKFVGMYGKQDSLKMCGECHGKKGIEPTLKGKMDCTPCHSGSKAVLNKFVEHPS